VLLDSKIPRYFANGWVPEDGLISAENGHAWVSGRMFSIGYPHHFTPLPSGLVSPSKALKFTHCLPHRSLDLGSVMIGVSESYPRRLSTPSDAHKTELG